MVDECVSISVSSSVPHSVMLAFQRAILARPRHILQSRESSNCALQVLGNRLCVHALHGHCVASGMTASEDAPRSRREDDFDVTMCCNLFQEVDDAIVVALWLELIQTVNEQTKSSFGNLDRSL